MSSKRKIKVDYSAREFGTIKEQLKQYAKRYYADSYQDFNEAGFGSLVLDTVAYVGDMLSFYLDYQANESFLETANERKNVLKLAKQLGYKHENAVSSTGLASFYVLAPANADGEEPDERYIPILRKNTSISSRTGVNFTLIEDVRFDGEENEIAPARFDSTTGLPTYYAIKSYGTIVSGRYERISIDIGDFKKFAKVRIPLENIVEIISVKDAEGFEYYEVDSLSQDVIYRPVKNWDSSDRQASYLMKQYYVPRRFVVDKEDDDITYLQFGHGNQDDENNTASISDPSNVVLKYSSRDYVSDVSFDPNKLINSNKLGIAPANTTIEVLVRVSDPDSLNISANTLVNIDNPILSFGEANSLDQDVLGFIRNNLEVTNEEQITGTSADLSTEEIKRLASNSFAAQNRAVTKEDYENLIYRMPKKFGNVKRVRIIRDSNSFKRNLNAYVVGMTQDRKLAQCSPALKQNIKVWLSGNKMINDTIDILDAKIINLSINFQITVDPRYQKDEILSKCLNRLREQYNTIPQIGESFVITDVYRVLREVVGVLDVVSVNIFNKTSAVYSRIALDIDRQRSADGRYIVIPDNAIYEIKYPNQDIIGAVV